MERELIGETVRELLDQTAEVVRELHEQVETCRRLVAQARRLRGSKEAADRPAPETPGRLAVRVEGPQLTRGMAARARRIGTRQRAGVTG
jgi:hypothetical protein